MTEPTVDNTPSMLTAQEETLEKSNPELNKAYLALSLDDIDLMNERIIAPLQDDELVVTTDMTRKVTVRMIDKGYRAKLVEANSEYFVTDLILARSNRLIVRFTPIDDREWDAIELGAAQADQMFPELGAKLLAAHGIESAAESLPQCIHLVMQNFDVEKEAAAVAAQYEDNPMFGMF